MSVRGLRKVDVEVPILGINTRVSQRALDPPATIRCSDVEFTELGELTLRKPYTSLGTSIVGGGTISEPRRLATYNDELLLFTKTHLYTYSEADSAWVERAEYLAPKVTERTVFARTTEQIECDRASLGGVTFFCWWEGATSSVYLAAIDTATRAVLLAPTAMATGPNRPKLIALQNKVLLFATSTVLYGKVLDPTDIATTAAAAWTLLSVNSGGEYDVAALTATSAVVAMQDSTSTRYQVMSVTEALAVSNNTKLRTCDGPIAVAVSADSFVIVARANGTAVEADVLTSGLVDDDVGLSLMTTTAASWNQIAAAFRSVQDSGAYRCYVFASSGETSDETDFITEYNWVDTGGSTGTEAALVHRLGVATRAYDHEGQVYVWLAFAGDSATVSTTTTEIAAVALQNTYFCYRDDGALIAKSTPATAGGFSATTGHLPNVQSEGAGLFAWAATERRRVPLDAGTDYSDRGPREVFITFDSNEARRTAQAGRTLYVTGGQVLQFDGQDLVEVGFHIYPWVFDYNTAAGNIDYTKAYTYRITWRWDNATGERERSTSSAQLDADLTGAGSNRIVSFSLVPLHTTLKHTVRAEPAVEVWRTLGNPVVDAPMYLTTSLDPSNGVNPNAYLANDFDAASVPAFDDNLTDDELDDRETFEETGGVLASLSPPPSTIIAATDDRVFLAGISYDDYLVWYSKLRGQDQIAAFNDGLTFRTPISGGPITALAILNETLIVFKDSAIYAYAGNGFDNLGEGQNYGPPQQISTDVGALSAEVVGITPDGIVFQSRKGWHLLDPGFGVNYIGSAVDEYDSETWVAVHSIERAHQVRCLSESRCLVYDTVAKQWSTWTLTGGKDAVFYDGVYTYLDGTTARSEASTYTGVDYGLDVEMAWFKLDRLQGFGRVYDVHVLGEYRGAHDLRVRLSRDYAAAVFQDKTWTVTPTSVGGPLQVRHKPSIQKVQALKIRLTAHSVGTTDPPSSEALKLTGLRFRVGTKPAGFRLPAAQKQ